MRWHARLRHQDSEQLKQTEIQASYSAKCDWYSTLGGITSVIDMRTRENGGAVYDRFTLWTSLYRM